ncbi:MAG: restriction endonuclease subunit S, partial [Bacteroidales bacterium]|nr:restriction endonuclease subunit S [Bacteroidales bacterium]
PIVVPPMEEQRGIAAELDAVQKMIDGYREQIADLDTLARSIFLDLFGDPISNPKGWPITTIGEECMLKSGDSSANNFPKGLTPYVKVADMNLPENQFMITTSSRFVDCSQKPKGVFPRGTVIFPKRGGAITTGKLAIASQPIICDLNIMGVIPNASVHSIYLYFCFKNVDFSELFDGTTVPQINNTDIAPLKINFPPLALQQQFAEKVEAIEKQKAWVREQLADAEMLMKERMQYYFN